MNLFPLFLLLALSVSGCKGIDADYLRNGSCISCHSMTLDPAHSFACFKCHGGNDRGKTQETAHQGLVSQPAHPDNYKKNCGPCHPDQVQALDSSNHLTLAPLVNTFTQSFGGNGNLQSFQELPAHKNIQSESDLAGDLLRSRCLRCHLYSSGDTYPAVQRGTGCAACHLRFQSGKLTRHEFVPPQDQQCLSCHYGNRVGFDYYGRFEHDLHDEYKTPFAEEKKDWAYGVAFHHLQPDIHQQAGMTCMDCHSGAELMASPAQSRKPACENCHVQQSLQSQGASVIEQRDGEYRLTTRAGAHLNLPLADDDLHRKFQSVATCQVCHAQWSYSEGTTHMLRSDLDEYLSWSALTSQGDSSLEKLLQNNIDFDRDELPPESPDGLSGDPRTGIWHKGFIARRWENIPIGKRSDGKLSVMRPSLDYTLSWIDAEETVHFDNIRPLPDVSVYRPYTPHTTGPAGMFWQQRLSLLQKDSSKNSNTRKNGK